MAVQLQYYLRLAQPFDPAPSLDCQSYLIKQRPLAGAPIDQAILIHWALEMADEWGLTVPECEKVFGVKGFNPAALKAEEITLSEPAIKRIEMLQTIRRYIERIRGRYVIPSSRMWVRGRDEAGREVSWNPLNLMMLPSVEGIEQLIADLSDFVRCFVGQP